MFKQLLIIVVSLVSMLGSLTVGRAAAQGLPRDLLAGRTPIDHCQTIAAPGSYVLIKSLQATGDCLVIAASFVTLDLNGQTLTGTGGLKPSGITDNRVARDAITIRNGTVTSFGNGVFLTSSSGSHIEKVHADQNGANGITVADGSIVNDCIALKNGVVGIQVVGAGSVVVGSVADGNGQLGISVGFASTVTGNTANGNGDEGIGASLGSTLTGNTATNNVVGFGIFCPSTLIGNTSVGNTTPESESGSGCNKVNNLGF